MINFSSTPLQSDLSILKSIAKNDESMLQALDKEDIALLQKALRRQTLVPKKVLVHGQHGTYWAIREVNPDPDSNSSATQKLHTKTDDWLVSRNVGDTFLRTPSSKDADHSKPKQTLVQPSSKDADHSKPKSKSSSTNILEAVPHNITPPLIDPNSTLSREDQKAIQSSSEEEKAIFTAVGLFGGDDEAIKYLAQYKQKLDKNAKYIHARTFSQTHLDESKQNMFENYEYCLTDEFPLGNTPNEFLINYRNGVIDKLTENPNHPLFSIYLEAAQQWKADVESGKISKDDPDIFFVYARESILNKDMNFDFGGFQMVYGIDLMNFVPKDNNAPPIFSTKKSIKGKIVSVPPNSQEYKQIQEEYAKNYDKRLAVYNKNNNTFESDLFSNVYTIKGIYKIEGLPGETEFQQIKNQHIQHKNQNYGGKNGYSDRFFHGTTLDSSFSILGVSGKFEQGMKENGSAFGLGLYVTDNVATAFKYMVHHNPYDMTGSSLNRPEGVGTNYTGCVFLCEGSLGKCEFGTHVHDLELDELDANTLSKKLNCDSVGCPPINWPNQEWKFNDPHAAIPRYVLEVEVTPKKKSRKKK